MINSYCWELEKLKKITKNKRRLTLKTRLTIEEAIILFDIMIKEDKK